MKAIKGKFYTIFWKKLMKRPWLNILFYVIGVAVIVFIAWKFIFIPTHQSYQLHTLWKNQITKNGLKVIPRKFF